jgi:site-specific DNA recombinase
MKAAIYSRVSTEGQEQEGTSLQTQLAASLDYCKTKGYEVTYQFSEAWSGLTLERPKLTELRDAVRSDNIDAVVVYSLDRFSRDPVHGVILMQELEKHDVSLEAATETVDNSEVGKLVFYIKGYAAKLDAERRRDATGRGKQAMLKQGKLPQGTGVGLYGYKWDTMTKKREIISFEADIVQDVFNKVANGESIISIAGRLNERKIPTKASKIGDHRRKLWHSLTIRRMVRNTGYIGSTNFINTVLTNVTPAIISEDLFNAANAELDRPKTRTGRPKHEYLLRKHAFCAICGGPLVGHCLNKKYLYYQCSNARPYENGGKKCEARYIRANDLEEIVWSKTRDVLSDPNIILRNLGKIDDKAGIDSLDHEIKSLQKILRKYEQRRTNLLEAMELGEFEHDEILDRLNNVKRLRQEDEVKLNDLLKTREHQTSLSNAQIKLGELYSRVLENLKHGTPEIKALALDALDIKVYARGADEIKIQGAIPLALPTTAQTSA